MLCVASTALPTGRSAAAVVLAAARSCAMLLSRRMLLAAAALVVAVLRKGRAAGAGEQKSGQRCGEGCFHDVTPKAERRKGCISRVA